jgi:hypothetical protein
VLCYEDGCKVSVQADTPMQFIIYRAEDDESSFQQIGVTTGTALIDLDAEPNTNYTYKVAAVYNGATVESSKASARRTQVFARQIPAQMKVFADTPWFADGETGARVSPFLPEPEQRARSRAIWGQTMLRMKYANEYSEPGDRERKHPNQIPPVNDIVENPAALTAAEKQVENNRNAIAARSAAEVLSQESLINAAAASQVASAPAAQPGAAAAAPITPVGGADPLNPTGVATPDNSAQVAAARAKAKADIENSGIYAAVSQGLANDIAQQYAQLTAYTGQKLMEPAQELAETINGFDARSLCNDYTDQALNRSEGCAILMSGQLTFWNKSGSSGREKGLDLLSSIVGQPVAAPTATAQVDTAMPPAAMSLSMPPAAQDAGAMMNMPGLPAMGAPPAMAAPGGQPELPGLPGAPVTVPGAPAVPAAPAEGSPGYDPAFPDGQI